MRTTAPQRQNTQNVTFPAANGGINSIDNLYGLRPNEVIYSYNIGASSYGMTVRPGYVEHTFAADSRVLTTGAHTGDFEVGEVLEDDVTAATGTIESFVDGVSITVIDITGSFGTNAVTGQTSGATATVSVVGADDPAMAGTTGVRTMIPFSGIAEDGTTDKLFAATDDGIYEVTSNGAKQDSDIVLDWAGFTGVGGDAGFCSFTQYTTITDNHILLCDQKNGYFTYTESTDTWAVGSLTGVTVGDVVFVTVWKNRIWFVERDSNDAWYIDTVGAISGNVTRFTFGNKFQYGGFLIGIYNWSRDSGDGPDDYLVALSKGGDLVVYAGYDPTDTENFWVVGVWFVGRMPAGRRVADEFGGDLLVLSSYGLISTNAIMQGVPPYSEDANLSWKISRSVNTEMGTKLDSDGWDIKLHPSDKLILVTIPKGTGEEYKQFVYNLDTKGWGFWRGVPINTSAQWRGVFYMGNTDNQVYKMEGGVDDQRIFDSTTVTAIDFSLLSSFQDFGSQGTYKRGMYLRPIFLSAGHPAYEASFRYDFDLTEESETTFPVVSTGTLWDEGEWDVDAWGGGEANVVTDPAKGGSGIGRYVAYAIRGSSAGQTTLVACDAMFDVGGLL